MPAVKGRVAAKVPVLVTRGAESVVEENIPRLGFVHEDPASEAQLASWVDTRVSHRLSARQ
jgi:hypothetical protein